jgi:hypothetical protein
MRGFVIALTWLFQGFGNRISYQATAPSRFKTRVISFAMFWAVVSSKTDENTIQANTTSNEALGKAKCSALPS